MVEVTNLIESVMDTKFKTMLERTFQVVTFTYSKIVIDVKKRVANHNIKEKHIQVFSIPMHS